MKYVKKLLLIMSIATLAAAQTATIPSAQTQDLLTIADNCFSNGEVISESIWVLQDKGPKVHQYVTISKYEPVIEFVYEDWSDDKGVETIVQTILDVDGNGLVEKSSCKTLVEKADGGIVSAKDQDCKVDRVSLILKEMVERFK